MNCREISIPDLVHGFLEEEEAARARAHIRDCPDCDDRRRALERERDLLREAAAAWERRRAAPPPGSRRYREFAGIAAALLLCVGVLLWIASAPSRPAPRGGPSDRIARLVAEIGTPDAATADVAAAEIVQIGEPARPTLEAARSGASRTVRRRLEAILSRLDRRRDRAAIERASGRVGETGMIWIRREVFDLIARAENLPDWMKPALVDGQETTFLFVEAPPDRTDRSAVRAGPPAGASIQVYQGAGGPDRKPTLTFLQHRLPRMLAAPMGRPSWLRRLRSGKAYELFAYWPRLRRTSLVFVSPHAREHLFSAYLRDLSAACGHPAAFIRAAAVSALRWYYVEQSVARAFSAARDPEHAVQSAGRATLRVLLGERPGQPHDWEVWWNGLDAARRREVLLTSSSRIPPNSYPWFSDQ